MTGSVALDIVIGLVFIYLLYSLLATIIQEAIANVFNFRAKFLQRALIRMLEDSNSPAAKTFWTSIGSMFANFSKPGSLDHMPLTKAFYEHPLIKYLSEDDHHKPSYLKAQNFSKTLIDLLRGNSFATGDDPRPFIAEALKAGKIRWQDPQAPAKNALTHNVAINPDTLAFLQSIWADAQGDAVKFRVLLEGWFDTTMERTTDWYKKHTQALLLMIGLLIALLFNVDTIKIADSLAKDPELRQEIVRQADNYVKINQAEFRELEKLQISKILTPADSAKKADLTTIKKTADSLISRAGELVNGDIAKVNQTLAIGWQCKCPNKNAKTGPKDPPECGRICIKGNLRPSSVLGWVITAFALSLGAPFWFDILSKLMKVRGSVSSGTKEEKETKTGKKDTLKDIKG